MDWYEITDAEREATQKIHPQELKNLIAQAIDSEWWKYLRVRLSQTLKSTDTQK